MPRTVLLFYCEADETCPLVDWLDAIPRKAKDKCIVRMERLQELGYELRRPEADILRDGIYELRIGHQGVNYRILYFFHGNAAVVVSHGLTKERVVPPGEIDLAIRRRDKFKKSPQTHSLTEIK